MNKKITYTRTIQTLNTCTRCTGSGHIWQSAYHNRVEQTPCPTCKGSGQALTTTTEDITEKIEKLLFY